MKKIITLLSAFTALSVAARETEYIPIPAGDVEKIVSAGDGECGDIRYDYLLQGRVMLLFAAKTVLCAMA